MQKSLKIDGFRFRFSLRPHWNQQLTAWPRTVPVWGRGWRCLRGASGKWESGPQVERYQSRQRCEMVGQWWLLDGWVMIAGDYTTQYIGGTLMNHQGVVDVPSWAFWTSTFKYLLEIGSPRFWRGSIGTFTNPCLRGISWDFTGIYIWLLVWNVFFPCLRN